MKISIFTPTHNPQYLGEAYKYLQEQDYYEWVILLNNGATTEGLPDTLLTDSRNKFISYDLDISRVGALKKCACSHCSGDWMVELDHDDLLVPGALDLIKEAATKNPGASLIYSNCADFNDDETRSSREFAEGNGWVYRDFNFDGFSYREAVTPEPIPYHASLILWQPNHLRAFNKKHYDAVGGHNESMNVLDDQDLMCRLYTQGPFVHIDKCLYLYRVTGTNTWLQRNQEIQQNMFRIQESNLWHLAASWAHRSNLPILDLGGRFTSIPGALSVDLKDADINCDLNETWPFEDSSVGVIRACDIIEHLPDIIHTMSEIHRVLVPGGYAFIEVPSTDGRGAWQDPSHVSFWNENSFWYYTDRNLAQYIDNKTIRFKAITLETHFPSDWHKEHNISYVRADLLALKGGVKVMGLELI